VGRFKAKAEVFLDGDTGALIEERVKLGQDGDNFFCGEIAAQALADHFTEEVIFRDGFRELRILADTLERVVADALPRFARLI